MSAVCKKKMRERENLISVFFLFLLVYLHNEYTQANEFKSERERENVPERNKSVQFLFPLLTQLLVYVNLKHV